MAFNRDMEPAERNIAFTDIETTGLVVTRHEILEIGAVITNSKLEVISEVDLKVKPRHIETADPWALDYNGYKPEDWGDAVDLPDALKAYSDAAENAIFSAQNPTFDWGFLQLAFEQEGVASELDYHRIDTFSIAWHALKKCGLKKFTLPFLIEELGVEPEPMPHRAINGARLNLAVYRELMKRE